MKQWYRKYKLRKHLKRIEADKIDRFSFDGIKTLAFVCSCYDGDTCTIIFRWNKKDIKISCRIVGIDTPELRTKNMLEKDKAIKARDYLRNLILNKIVNVELFKFDKYGRPLVKIGINGKDVSELMIKHKFAVPYYGGKKQKFSV